MLFLFPHPVKVLRNDGIKKKRREPKYVSPGPNITHRCSNQASSHYVRANFMPKVVEEAKEMEILRLRDSKGERETMCKREKEPGRSLGARCGGECHWHFPNTRNYHASIG